ncbi:MAG: IPT/TIG domain-containing protein, partial [Acidobacteriota bacterium]|nr:IPT/TIG domain-containing protein [Acidobacteriota bacterium]
MIAYAHKDGPDPRRTGAPGDAPTACTGSGCHSGPLNNFGGGIQIMLPEGNSYKPGVKQHIMVRVAETGQRRWGFQFTARLASNLANGQAGDLVPAADGFTQVLCTDGRAKPCRAGAEVQFIEHTLEGTRLGTRDGATFEFDWTPPSNDAGDIVFYAAGNAANGNGDEFGDHIYTTSVRLSNCPTSGPKPSITSVVNGASFEKGIASNSWITINGTNLASTTRAWGAGDFPGGSLPVGLSCTSVMVNNKSAYVEYVSPTQINAVAPADAASGPVPVSVTSVGQTSNDSATQLQPL